MNDLPITERVQRIRAKYRASQPKIDIHRYRLVTEFYQGHTELTGIMRKARCFQHICENIPVYIDDDEIFVGTQGIGFRAVALYPEVHFANGRMLDEIRSGEFMKRTTDFYLFDDEDIDYVLETGDYWLKNAVGAQMDAYVPEDYGSNMDFNGVITFGSKANSATMVGHFIGGFKNIVDRGYGSYAQECQERMNAVSGRIFGDTVGNYEFYHAVKICIEGIQTLYRRYADEAFRLSATTDDDQWAAELKQTGESLLWLAENPPRTFEEVLQMLIMHNLCLAFEGNLHGLSFGRLDALLGSFYRKGIAEGTLTHERAQELMDVFFLKVAQTGKVMDTGLGYTTGLLMTLGGVDPRGHDVTNEVSYLMLASSRRLVLHDPPLAMRVHQGTPDELWDAAIETTRVCGGVPTFENDDVIIPSLMRHGLSTDDAMDYGIVGCVEPGGNGCEWTCAGGDGGNNFFNLPGCVLLALNDGVNPMPRPDGMPPAQAGLHTGYLYEMDTYEEVLDAVWKQMEYFVNWQMTMLNVSEYVSRQQNPLPVASFSIDGCMESGRDVMNGGAKYNSCGVAGIGVGNIIDSLATIKYLCFDHHICSTRELYDAVMANWEGYEDLRQRILAEVPHYGNDDPYVDEIARVMTEHYDRICTSAYGARSRMRPGLWPVTSNVYFGLGTWATFDGRRTGEPLADGCGAVQARDTSGPTSALKSVAWIDQRKFGNGTLLNMKFHPAALAREDGKRKLQALMETYFALGGMQLQINVTDTAMLRAAQERPDEYKDLVVRIAGFSVYFVEMPKISQDDLITRTELSL